MQQFALFSTGPASVAPFFAPSDSQKSPGAVPALAVRTVCVFLDFFGALISAKLPVTCALSAIAAANTRRLGFPSLPDLVTSRSCSSIVKVEKMQHATDPGGHSQLARTVNSSKLMHRSKAP
jgi:hypothetical protein